MSRPPRGLTLIELVAAMAIFALVAVMGAQAMSGMLRQRDGLLERSDQAAALEFGTSLLRADLAAAVPMLFYPPGTSAPRSSARLTADGFALSVAGQPRLDLSTQPRFHRVVYRLDPSTGTLWRRHWGTLSPANSSALSPEILVLQGVTRLELRSHWGPSGWQPGLSTMALPTAAQPKLDGDGPGAAPEVYSNALPLAIELTLHLDTLGPIRLLETLQ
jgi:general secretion pathway protein J